MTEPRDPRILLVTEMPPWPRTRGAQQRLHAVAAALATVGRVELFSWADDAEASAAEVRPTASDPATDLDLERVEIVRRPERKRPWWMDRVPWRVRSELPSALYGKDVEPVRGRFCEWRRERYDLAWFSHAATWSVMADLVDGPLVVDLDDLEHRKVRQSMRIRKRALGEGWWAALRGRGLEAVNEINARRWEALFGRIVGSAAAVTVCSDVDRERLGGSRVVVIPNGYDRVEADAAAGTAPAGAPRILTQGSLTYAPNVDGARWMAEAVWPRVRRARPDAELRFAGRAGEAVERLAALEGVTVTGFVEDMRAEVRAARIVAVPIRIGSGTRIKILEAFACGVPVVSTSIGAEGLAVVDGEHLRIADTPEAFAAACVELLEDEASRTRLAAGGRALLEERYLWEDIGERIAALARSLLAGDRSGREIPA